MLCRDCERLWASKREKKGKMLEYKCTCIKKATIYIHIFFDELVSAFFQFCVCMMSESIKSAHTKHFGAHSDYVVLHEKIPIQKKTQTNRVWWSAKEKRLRLWLCKCAEVSQQQKRFNEFYLACCISVAHTADNWRFWWCVLCFACMKCGPTFLSRSLCHTNTWTVFSLFHVLHTCTARHMNHL